MEENSNLATSSGIENPDKDPNDKYFLKFCFVCQEEAKPNQDHIRNFGGIVCFSCRAFFRRAHQKSKIPQFSCKGNDSCIVTVPTRRRCQSCRYKLCLQAGMKPELVLSEDQKLIRFRKLLLKKKMGIPAAAKSEEKRARSKKSPQPSTSGSCSGGNVETLSSSSTFGATPGSFLPYLDSDLSLDDILNEESNSGRIPKDLFSKCREIVDSYKSVIFQSSGGNSSQYFENLVAFHLGKSEISLNNRDVLINMLSLSSVFYQFALKQSEFQMLGNIEQKKLIDRNTPLYIQLLLVSYFGAENGAEQLGFINNFCQGPSTHSARGVFFMTLQNFNTISQLFKFDSDLVYFCNLIAKARSVNLVGIEQQALMAYMVLFDSLKELESCQNVKAIAKRNEQIFQNCIQKINPETTMEEISSWLVKMAVFFSYNVLWSEKEPSPSEAIITMVYTDEEECWLQKQVDLLEMAFRSVPMGEEIIEEFAMYSLGVPLSKHYMSRIFAVCKERIWRIFQTQTEFLNLTFQLQLQLVNTNSLMVFCLMLAKWESYKTGLEQVQYAFGVTEEEYWTSKYEPVFGRTKLKKLGTLESTYDLQNGLSEAQKSEVMQTFEDLSGLISDPSIYGLMLFMVSSRPIEGVSIESIAKLNSTYSLLMRRRLSSQLSCKENQMYSTPLEAKISKGFSNVEKLAKIFGFFSVH